MIEQETLSTPDGTVTILDTRDILDVLDKYVGHEFASYVVSIIDESENERAYEEARAQTDADAIAEENDELRSELLDAQNIIDEMANDIIDSKRLNKQEMYKKLVNLSSAIQEVL